MDNNRDFDDLELNHLLGPFKRLNPQAGDKAKWRSCLENTPNPINVMGTNRFFKVNPWALALFLNLILAFSVVLSLPIVNSKLMGHTITIQMKHFSDPKSYDVLASLSAIKNAKLFWPESWESRSPQELTLIDNNTALNIKMLEEQIMGVQDVEKLLITPIIKKEKKRLYQSIFNLFLLNEENGQECYDYFLTDKKIMQEEKALFAITHIATLAKPETVNGDSIAVNRSRSLAKSQKSLIRKVKAE